MTTTTTVIDQLLSPAESLFHDNRRAGRTGMITCWCDLTPRQRAGYQRAATLPGHTYSLTLDKLVALGAMYDTSATSPPGR